jgi:sulfite exporter TauE/SafE
VYCVLGVLAGVFGEFVVHQFFESKILVFLFLFFGLFLCVVGFLLIIEKFSLGQRCSGLFHRHLEQKDVKNIVIFGLIVSLAPCLPLMAVLSYIALISDHWLKGIAYMGSFGLGTAVSPMIILSLGAGWIARKVRNHQKFSRWVKILCGVILMFLGFMMVLSYGYPWVKEF